MVRFFRVWLVLASLVLPSATMVRAGWSDSVARAAEAGDLTGVRELIASGEDVNARLGDGSAPLLWAAYHFDVEMARALIAGGADVDIANDYGITPLLQASRTGDAAMVGILLEAGASPELSHPDGETPLMAASRSGNARAVGLLIEAGADVNAADVFQNETALMWASAEGHAEVVDTLLQAGADPDLQARVTSITERQNADYPTGGFTALMWAARNGDRATIGRLVDGGANLDLKNGDGASATMIAIYNDHFDSAATLVDLGADVNDGSLYTAVEMRASTTDQFAFDGSRLRPDHENTRTALDLVELLLERGADPHQWFTGQFHSTSMPNSDRFNNTPFLRAAAFADVEALKVFLDYVSDVDLIRVPPPVEEASEEPGDAPPAGGRGGNPNAGRTATMIAMTGGRPPAMTGGPGYIRDGEAPYREPGSRKPEDALRLLLEAGASPDAKAPDGTPLLGQAVQSGNLDIIRSLADAGVDFDQTNDDGLTALEVAEGRGGDGGPAGRGGRGRGGRRGPSEEVAALLRELMGLPPAPARAPADEAAVSPQSGGAL